MGVGGLIQNAVLVAVLCLASAVAWQTLLRTSPIHPLPVHLLPRPPAEGVYAPNLRLNNAEKVGSGLIPGGEDLAVDREGRSFFTGCSDGWIKRVWVDQPGAERVENWTFVGGRPLGLALGPKDELIVCAGDKGLLNVTADKVEVLCTEAGGLPFKTVDGVDVTKEGVVYFTELTYKYSPKDILLGVYEYLPHGRLLKYDPSTKTATVLLTDLYFPNAVALSKKEDFFIYCETLIFRCRKYWLEGEKAGKVETFIENLPGFPDNVILDDDGIYWIGLLGERNMYWDLAAKYASLRHLLLRISSFINLNPFLFPTAGVVGVREDGEAIAYYSDPKRSFITSGVQMGGRLYFVSLRENSIGRSPANFPDQ